MLQSTSPPTPAFTAARPVITPRDVVRMLVPSPPARPAHRRGRSRRGGPGRLMRWTPVISFSPCGPYFRNRRSVLTGAVVFVGGVVDELEALDVAFVLKDPRDVGLQPRRRHIDARVLGGHGVADPREHVGNRICHISTFDFGHWVSWSSHALRMPSPMTDYHYQLLFVTPVTSPSSASLRKHRRHSANFRM